MRSSCGQRRLWPDWADAQADLSLRWAHRHFVGFITKGLKSFHDHESKVYYLLSITSDLSSKLDKTAMSCICISVKNFSFILTFISLFSFQIFIMIRPKPHDRYNYRVFTKTKAYFSIIWARSCENVSYAICEQQRRRSACASAQSDQRLYCSLLG